MGPEEISSHENEFRVAPLPRPLHPFHALYPLSFQIQLIEDILREDTDKDIIIFLSGKTTNQSGNHQFMFTSPLSSAPPSFGAKSIGEIH